MAVVIASDLAKDMAGEPLLRGVSFKLERRDRLTLSGRNGSGKTTLLRMLSGESGIDGGELVFAKDVKVALHDQRPPRDRDLTLRDYVLSGCQELLALEERLASLEQAMADGATDSATLDAYASRAGAARARRRLQLARGRQLDAARARVPRRAPRPLAGDVLRRRADARVAGAGAGRRSRTCCCSTSPPTISTSSRWSGSRRTCSRWTPRSCWSRTTAGSWRRWARRCWSSRPGAREVLQGHVARVAGREGAARAGARAGDREAAGGDREARAVRRPLPRRHARQAGAVAREEAREDRSDDARPEGRQVARVRVQAARAVRPGRVRARGRRVEDRLARAAARRRAVARARRARVAGRRQRLGQDDADHGADRRARVRRRQAPARPQRQARPARRSTPTICRARPGRCWRRASARRS